MVISIDVEKVFDKIQHHFMLKKKKKDSKEWKETLKFIKDLCEKPIANCILNDERLKAFPLWSTIRQGCLLLSLLFNIVLQVLASAIQQEEGGNGFQIGKEEVKLYSEMTLSYMQKILKKPHIHKLLEQMSSTKLQETRSTYKNQLYFYILAMNSLS